MTPSADPTTLKMRDLCDATGLNRQAIHFYIQQGLLPPGEKTGRNTATYTPAHLERLQLIRRLQHERFLPLEVIKDLLSAREDRYSDTQRGFLRRLRARLKACSTPRTCTISTASASPGCAPTRRAVCSSTAPTCRSCAPSRACAALVFSRPWVLVWRISAPSWP